MSIILIEVHLCETWVSSGVHGCGRPRQTDVDLWISRGSLRSTGPVVVAETVTIRRVNASSC